MQLHPNVTNVSCSRMQTGDHAAKLRVSVTELGESATKLGRIAAKLGERTVYTGSNLIDGRARSARFGTHSPRVGAQPISVAAQSTEA